MRLLRLVHLRHALGVSVGILLLATSLAGCSSTGTSSEPRAGGVLKVGVVGGSTKDTLVPWDTRTHPDQARVLQLFDTLATYDTGHHLQMELAKSITPSDGDQIWTVRLRDGLKFSDGSPLTSADVASTFRVITDPKDPKGPATSFSSLDRDKIETPDPSTVIFHFKEPFVWFEDAVAYYKMAIVPADFDPNHPVGSGPFKFESITPGQQSVFVKNPYYWRQGEPHIDKLIIIDFPDDTARVNALLSGQVQAIDQVPPAQADVIKKAPNLKILESKTGNWLPFTMRVDKPPFNDPRVRQAFRLIVNREQFVTQVLDGHGTIGNDMYAPFDPCYPTNLPQRSQNIDEAKKLLAEAGQKDLHVTLVTSPVSAGVVEAAQLFAEQAKAAGVTVNVRQVDSGTFYGPQYLKWTFAQDYWYTRDYLEQVAYGSLPTAPYSETHWNDPEWVALVQKANRTGDNAQRCDLIRQAMRIEYDRGGYIIPAFPNNVDAYSSEVHGLTSDTSGLPLTSYGFRNVTLSK